LKRPAYLVENLAPALKRYTVEGTAVEVMRESEQDCVAAANNFRMKFLSGTHDLY
jgi:hypothetical protein